MEKECKHCGKIIKYDKPQQFGGHLSSCELNPSRKQRLEKSRFSKSKKLIFFTLNCQKCNKEYVVQITEQAYDKGKYTKFCCRSCANSHIRTDESNLKASSSIKNSEKYKEFLKNKKLKEDNKRCKICGSLKELCTQSNICKKRQLSSTLIKYFGFDQRLIGTKEVCKEYDRIKENLHKSYWEDKLSMAQIADKYANKNTGSVNNILNALEIKKRSRSDCNRNSIITGRKNQSVVKNQYKSGWHTTWDNKQVYLRSSYELDYAKQLDDNQIVYEVEKMKILYWDSQRNIQRVAIPDFYLTKTNEIIEIKGSYTYNEQNMKDRFKAFKNHGYICKLILNKKEVVI